MKHDDAVVNPWYALSDREELVLDADRDAVEEHNRSATPAHRFRLDLVPEPFLGSRTPKGILLNANPGFSIDDSIAHRDPDFRAAALRNLRHESSDWPFYLLDPRLAWTSGACWWRLRLGALHRLGGLSWETIANGLLALETVPYHSAKFKRPRLEVPSHRYTRTLLRWALARAIPVLHMRGSWIDVSPVYPQLHRAANPQCAYVTPRNAGAGFDALVAALRG